VNAVLVDPSNTSDILVGTDLGVFQSTNSGTTWTQQNNGMANVAVFDLDVRGDGALFASTHGRGMFKLDHLTDVAGGAPPEHPRQFSLAQNYPNPFNPTTEIEFNLSSVQMVKLQVYDMLGKEVATLVDGTLPPGEHKVAWDAGGRPSGVYIYTLKAGANFETRMMTLIR
jgi:hypothetical protein